MASHAKSQKGFEVEKPRRVDYSTSTAPILVLRRYWGFFLFWAQFASCLHGQCKPPRTLEWNGDKGVGGIVEQESLSFDDLQQSANQVE